MLWEYLFTWTILQTCSLGTFVPEHPWLCPDTYPHGGQLCYEEGGPPRKEIRIIRGTSQVYE